MVVAPAELRPVRQPTTWNTRWPELATLILGACASAGIAWLTHQSESWRQTRGNLERTEVVARGLREALVGTLTHVQGVADAYDPVKGLSAAEFSRVARTLIKPPSSLAVLEWIPRVSASERQSFEAAARADGLKGFTIRERLNGQLAPVAMRPDYFPSIGSNPSVATRTHSVSTWARIDAC